MRHAIFIAAALFSIAAPGAALAQARECWNPHAGHYEGVRPGETQNDLDFSRCRSYGGRYYDNSRYAERRYYGARQECWNPRAGHYEEVRPGEAQGDLDFGRCRTYR